MRSAIVLAMRDIIAAAMRNPAVATVLHRVAWLAGVDGLRPNPDLGSCEADVLRAPEFEHAVQHVDGDGHLGFLTPAGLRA